MHTVVISIQNTKNVLEVKDSLLITSTSEPTLKTVVNTAKHTITILKFQHCSVKLKRIFNRRNVEVSRTVVMLNLDHSVSESLSLLFLMNLIICTGIDIDRTARGTIDDTE